ncbi:MAG TPA: hypothetical protein VF867_04355 [Arthrobacter sp.]
MQIPSRYQGYLEDEDYPVERVRKSRGKVAAFRSSKPEVRRQVRLDSLAEAAKIHRSVRALKVTILGGEGLAELFNLAYDAYRTQARREGRTVSARTYMAEENLHRITVNYLRHTRTVYDANLLRTRCTTGNLRDIYNRELKIRCLEIIADTHPALAGECDRQRLSVSRSLEESAGQMLAAA